MATATLRERVAAVEREVSQLKEQLAEDRRHKGVPWWEQRFGAFADSPEYEDAARLGREYRESLRTAEASGEAP
jgi:hypothetical protein